MFGPHDPLAWALVKAGLSGWGAAFAAMLAFSEEVNGALLAASVALLAAFLLFVQKLANLLLRLARAWVDYKVALYMRGQGFDEMTIGEVLDDDG